MNPRDLVNFLRAPTGALLSFGIVLGCAFLLVKGFSKPEKPEAKPKASTAAPIKKMPTEHLLQSVHRASLLRYLPDPRG